MKPTKYLKRKRWFLAEERRVQSILDEQHEAAIDAAADTGQEWTDYRERMFWKHAEIRREKMLSDANARFEAWYAEQSERDAG